MNYTRRKLLAVFAIFALIAACGDPYGATNPYDPDFPVTFAITGPDTIFSAGQLAHFTVQTTPAFPDTAFRWESDTATVFVPGSGFTIVDGATLLAPSQPPGSFESITMPLEPATVTVAVAALVGSVDTTLQRYIAPNYVTVHAIEPRHVGYKSVVLMQRLTRIQHLCPAAHACDTLSLGSARWSMFVNGFDANNNPIATLPGADLNPSTGAPVAIFSVRDTTIATVSPVGIRAATVTALKAGSTWILATRGALVDSLQVVAR
jgi:hypothetical protein